MPLSQWVVTLAHRLNAPDRAQTIILTTDTWC